MMRLAPVLAGAALAACVLLHGDEDAPLPTELRAAPAGPARTLVVVLGGLVDDEETLENREVHEVVHREWPRADVLLVGATFPYYQGGTLITRLHEIIAPAQHRYEDVFLIGASLGATGVLMYEHDHPGTVTGIVLLAPWLGSSALLEQIERAGGLARWNPGKLPDRISAGAFDRQVWAMVKGWRARPERARRIWLACGAEDHRMLAGARLLAAELPPGHYLERPGGHKWTFWHDVGPELLARLAASPHVAGGGERTNGRVAPSK